MARHLIASVAAGILIQGLAVSADRTSLAMGAPLVLLLVLGTLVAAGLRGSYWLGVVGVVAGRVGALAFLSVVSAPDPSVRGVLALGAFVTGETMVPALIAGVLVYAIRSAMPAYRTAPSESEKRHAAEVAAAAPADSDPR